MIWVLAPLKLHFLPFIPSLAYFISVPWLPACSLNTPAGFYPKTFVRLVSDLFTQLGPLLTPLFSVLAPSPHEVCPRAPVHPLVLSILNHISSLSEVTLLIYLPSVSFRKT